MLWILLCVCGAAAGPGEGGGRRQAPSPWEPAPSPASPPPYPWAIVWGPTESGSAEGRPGERRRRRRRTTGRSSSSHCPEVDTDPQIYVTLIISCIIVLSAVGILLKFVWDRHKQRVRCRGMATGESRQGLVRRWMGPGDVADGGRGIRGGGGGGGVGFAEIGGLWGPLGTESLSAPGEGTRVSGTVYVSNRIPLVNM
ncbi:PILR alpha-associated neural protein-like [Mobula hypostoma]|uniref:PILR alpha-associated neural protein-like n=1 Tax=Mobula hypostoma TaxID=723540 RepID=UPI002FC34106